MLLPAVNDPLLRSVYCGSIVLIWLELLSTICPPHRWTAQRKAFGKPLNSLAVIRSKMAEMMSRSESTQVCITSIIMNFHVKKRDY